MRVIVIIKATKNSEAGVMPSKKLLTAMGHYNEELVAAGIMLSGEGLHPSSKGVRVSVGADAREATAGPFDEGAGLAAGFWIWQVDSMDQAIDWAKRCPAPMPGEQTHLEIRPLFEMDDFGDEMTPDLREKEQRLRDQLETDASSAVRTCLWFDGNAHEAAELYVSLVPDSCIESESRPAPNKPPLVVELSLGGTPYMFLNGGPHHKLTPAASIAVRTVDQVETDRLWDALVSDGGQESMCGWLIDRFGVSWQIVPAALMRMLGAKDRAAAGRATEAMLQMKKIDIAALETAFSSAS